MEGGKLPSESSPDDGRSGHETKPWWNADRVVAVVGVLFGLAVIVQGVVFRRRDRRVGVRREIAKSFLQLPLTSRTARQTQAKPT